MKYENKLVINEACEWDIYKKLVIYSLLAAGYKGNPYATASSLDMSFREIKDLPYYEWFPKILDDLAEYQKDCPELFND